EHSEPLSARLDLQVDPASHWNGHDVAGAVRTRVVNVAPADRRDEALAAGTLWQDLQLPEFELDLTVGEQKLAGQGSLGMPDSRLELDLAVSRLADLWPGLPGGARAKGWISGTLRQHATDLQATYTPADSQADKVGSAPIDAHVALQGGWGPLKQGQPRSEEHTSELQSRENLVCRLLLEKKK